MEDLSLKIDHVKQDNTGTTLFTDKQQKVYYKFLIVNKDKGICKWEIKNEESSIRRYFIKETDVDKIKKIKGTKADCVTNNDVGDLVNDSLILDSDKNILLVEGDNCISIKNRNDELIYERCFDNCIVKIRHIKTKGLPLTIISGKNSIDIEFYKKGNDWISNSVTCYIGEDKKSKEIVISLKEFDFNNIFGQFEDMKSNESTSSTDDKSVNLPLDFENLKNCSQNAVYYPKYTSKKLPNVAKIAMEVTQYEPEIIIS